MHSHKEGRNMVRRGILFGVLLRNTDRTKLADIFSLFGCIGDILEVVIPPKRNKLGKRFSFPKFRLKDNSCESSQIQ